VSELRYELKIRSVTCLRPERFTGIDQIKYKKKLKCSTIFN